MPLQQKIELYEKSLHGVLKMTTEISRPMPAGTYWTYIKLLNIQKVENEPVFKFE
jgi:hypothetical protein